VKNDFRRFGTDTQRNFRRAYNYTRNYNTNIYNLIDSDINQYELNQVNDDVTLAYLNNELSLEFNPQPMKDMIEANSVEKIQPMEEDMVGKTNKI